MLSWKMDRGKCMLISLMLLCFSATATAGFVGTFSWKTCGNTSDPIVIQSLDIIENSTESLYVSGKFKIATNLSSAIEGEVEFFKWVIWGWVPVPCIAKVGTCKYKDMCSLSPYSNDCPSIFADNDLPCHCPISQGKYSVKLFPINMDILPKWLEKGSYNIKLNMKSEGERLLCLKMSLKIR